MIDFNLMKLTSQTGFKYAFIFEPVPVQIEKSANLWNPLHFTWKINSVKNDIFHTKQMTSEEFSVQPYKWYVFLWLCDHFVSCVANDIAITFQWQRPCSFSWWCIVYHNCNIFLFAVKKKFSVLTSITWHRY